MRQKRIPIPKTPEIHQQRIRVITKTRTEILECLGVVLHYLVWI